MSHLLKFLLLVALFLAGQSYAQTIEYIHTDALGSPVAITDPNGNVIERSEYEPYGATLNRPADDRPGYTGHVVDAATGLNYMQQRYYDPTIGRFLSVDPIAADANLGVNFSRYWYANNNPYKFTDPDGRQSTEGAWNFIKGVAVGALDGAMEDAHYSSPNPTVEAYPGEFSQAEACDCDYQSPFADAETNEEQLGRDVSPAAVLLLTRKPTGSKVARSVRIDRIGRFTRKTEVRPGKGPGQSRAEYVRVKNEKGKTIRTYKDSYDRAGKFQGRKPLTGGPEGRPAPPPPPKKPDGT